MADENTDGVNLPGQGTKLHVLERTEKGVVISAQMSTYHDVKTVHDIAQQIAWLTAACRRSEPAKVSLSEILCFVTDEGTFQISLLPLKEVVEHREACWTPLFPGSVIAHRWPIPRRSGENGIELPFHLMTTLAGPLYPMKFGPGFCLKAHSRILFPTAIKNCESLHVQWHFESKTAGQLAPPWHHNHGDPWDKINSLDTKDMVGARTFLGYCKKAVVDLGTEKPIEYHRRILYSGLDDEDHAPAIGMPTTISVGTASLLPIKVDAMIPIIRSKAQLLAADLERDYMDVVYEAGERPVILYDSNGSARAWMVPLSCVLLHMVHTWSAKKATLTKNLPAIKLTSNSGTEARKILLEKWNFVVRKTIDTELHKDKLVRDLVMQFWKDICQKQFQDLLATTQADCNYEFQTQKLHGWEYMDVVDGKSSRRKQLTPKTNWGAFREECIVLCAKNLGDVIQPAEGVRVCDNWDPVRSNRMYLTASIHCLTTLAYQHGGEKDILTSFRLTNKGYWHYKSKELFLDCKDCGQRNCRKKPQYLHSTPPTHVQCLIPPSEGAVVFGRRLLGMLQPPAEGVERTSAGSRPHRVNILARATRRFRDRLERVPSGSTSTTTTAATLSNEPSEDVLSSEESIDYD